MSTTVIDVARDFTRHPIGRYAKDGPNSGERFRTDVLLPALRGSAGVIEVRLDSAAGYGSSFLEEAFGGLVREEGYTFSDLQSRLKLISEDAFLVEEVWDYIRDEDRRRRS